MFLLLPNETTRRVFRYCLALAQSVTRVRIHAVVVMSNHYHLVVTDPEGRLPEFHYILNKYVAKCLNAHYRRFENLWAAGVQGSLVRLGDDEALLDKAVYTITNPVACRLVKQSSDWPGLLLWRPGVSRARRPDWFFREVSTLPEELELEISPLPLGNTSAREAVARLAAAVASREEEIRARARAEGREFGDLKQLRRLKHTDSPATINARRGMSPRVASRDKWRRIELLQRLKTFVEDYRRALRAWLGGQREVVFPPGCYKMRRDFGVRCADC
jgi:putative transposase